MAQAAHTDDTREYYFPHGSRLPFFGSVSLFTLMAGFAALLNGAAIGGWVFGRVGDRVGRKAAMVISVTLMCVGSLMIAFAPTYATIGAFAPAWLLAARLIQGLSVGGEYGTTATYMSEVALRGRRGFYSSFQYVTLIGGQLLAMLVLLALQFVFLTPQQLDAWGWRIPFFIGAGLAVVIYFMRRDMHESEAFIEARALGVRGSPLRGLLRHPREVAIVSGSAKNAR